MTIDAARALLERAREIDQPRPVTSGFPMGLAHDARRDAQALRMEALVLAIAALLESQHVVIEPQVTRRPSAGRDDELPGLDARTKIDDAVAALLFARDRVEPVPDGLAGVLDDIGAATELLASDLADREATGPDGLNSCSCGGYWPTEWPREKQDEAAE